MKVGIVGSGAVGATAGYALVMRGGCREIVLVDLNQEGEAPAEPLRDGEYSTGTRLGGSLAPLI